MKENGLLKGIGIKTAALVTAVLTAAFALGGCASVNVFETDKLHVVASVYPAYSVAQMVAGDKAEILLMVKPGSDVHSWEPSTDDILMLEQADCFIYSGLGLETWTDDILPSLENKDLKLCELSEGIETLTFAESVTDFDEDGDEHEHEHEDEHEHGDEHEHEDEHEHHHDANSEDPHVWLSFENISIMAQNAAETLGEADPSNAAFYQENADKVSEACSSKNLTYQEAFAPYAGSSIIVSHEAFGYMCSDFGLSQIAIDGLSSSSEPDAQTMAVIIDYIKAEGITAVYYDSNINPDAASIVCDETDAELYCLNALGSVSEDDMNSGKTLLDFYEEDLNVLLEGLKSSEN